MGYLLYKGSHAGGLNFYNFGWEDNGKKKYVRIDVYTGEHKIIED